jgi:phage terminase large subunit
MTIADIELPPKLVDVFDKPRGSVRYRGSYGGRGSAKSVTFAKMAAVFGYAEPLRILGTRELQVSIKESFYAEVVSAIESEPFLKSHYDIGESFIKGKNGTEFIFRGLRHNMDSIKSMAQIDICIVEEAENVPESSWQKLIPTIRSPGSEIWVIWNPQREGSPVDIRFKKNPPKKSIIVEMNWRDNPWFPDVLNEERMNDLERMDGSTYYHIWEGAYLKASKSVIFGKNIVVKDFNKDNDTYYQGLDYGFSQDPDAAIRCFIKDDSLYISDEAGGREIELDQKSEFIKKSIPRFEEFYTRADSSRPETTSYLKRNGLPLVENVEKWPGSVQDGIAFIKSFKNVFIHPDCIQTIKELSLYSYKTDKLSGDILPDIVDSNNHYIDALRYALAPIIKQRIIGSFKGLSTSIARSESKRKLNRPHRDQKNSW